jgi:hypothetical protein
MRWNAAIVEMDPTTKHLFYTEIWALKCFVIFVEDSVKKPLLILW